MKFEDDLNSEISKSRVKAPNGKEYEVKGLSTLDLMEISDLAIERTINEESGKMLSKINSKLNTILTLKFGVIDPDLSKQSVQDVEKWLGAKGNSVIEFLIKEINAQTAKSKGTPEEIKK